MTFYHIKMLDDSQFGEGWIVEAYNEHMAVEQLEHEIEQILDVEHLDISELPTDY